MEPPKYKEMVELKRIALYGRVAQSKVTYYKKQNNLNSP
jgi:hypothetical protein